MGSQIPAHGWRSRGSDAWLFWVNSAVEKWEMKNGGGRQAVTRG